MMMAPPARSVIRPQTRSGTSSRRMQNAPASSRIRASSTIFWACAALLPWSRKPPRALALCGVSPRWPMTGMPGPGDAGHAVRHLGAALELHRVAAGLGHEAAGVADRRLDAGLVAHVRHVAHDPRVGGAPAHRRRVADHVVHRHRQRAVVAEHRHAQAVADEDHVDAGLVLEERGRVVVAGQPGDRGSLGRLGDQPGQGHPLPFGHRGLLCSDRVQRTDASCRANRWRIGRGRARVVGPEIG